MHGFRPLNGKVVLCAIVTRPPPPTKPGRALAAQWFEAIAPQSGLAERLEALDGPPARVPDPGELAAMREQLTDEVHLKECLESFASLRHRLSHGWQPNAQERQVLRTFLELLLPGLSEQARFVAKLDDLTSHAPHDIPGKKDKAEDSTQEDAVGRGC